MKRSTVESMQELSVAAFEIELIPLFVESFTHLVMGFV